MAASGSLLREGCHSTILRLDRELQASNTRSPANLVLHGGDTKLSAHLGAIFGHDNETGEGFCPRSLRCSGAHQAKRLAKVSIFTIECAARTYIMDIIGRALNSTFGEK